MRGLFRAFEQERVDYLLIGGQAAILYGAAHFTQDLDVWIRPSLRNIRAFLRALARVSARVHKLTPPLSVAWVRRGHGFHFLIPQAKRSPAYLDAMGRPPRAGPFGASARRARRMDTPWGLLPVASIEDLVELKKTNRPGDYEVVSRLARIRLGELRSPSRRQLAWAAENTFRVEDLLALRDTYGSRVWRNIAELPPGIHAVLAKRPFDKTPGRHAIAAAGRALDLRMAKFMERGRRHWLPILRDLRALRAAGKLLPEGLAVRELVPSRPPSQRPGGHQRKKR